MGHDWHSFLWTADEWIISYSVPPHTLTGVKMFSIGHALELYLKACYTKLTGDINKAINLSHGIPKIWKACKAEDPNFLFGHELRKSVLQRNLFDWGDCGKLAGGDLMHFLENSELYLVCKHLAELKYLGAPFKHVEGPIAFGTISCNPLWSTLFRELRSYLEYPEPGRLDLLRCHIEQLPEDLQLPAESVRFLKEIVFG